MIDNPPQARFVLITKMIGTKWWKI